MKQLTVKIKSITMSALIISGLIAVMSANAQTARDVSKYNLYVPGENLNGYDPVSYFPEGGGQPQMGKQDLGLDYMGVTYHFSTQANLNSFLLNSDFRIALNMRNYGLKT